MFKPTESKLKTSSLKGPINKSINRSSPSPNRNQIHGKTPQNLKKSGYYDIRFQRKDLREFQPRHYVGKDVSEQDVIQIKQVFDYYQSTGTGVLLPNDLKVFLNQNGFNPSKKTLYEIIAQTDQQETGGISFTEFMKVMVSEPRVQQVKQIFRKYARNKDHITIQDIKNMTKLLGEENDQETMQLMITRASKNHDKKLYFQEFENVMRTRFH